MIHRLIAPKWLLDSKNVKKAIEGQFTPADLKYYNDLGYNIYYTANSPSEIPKDRPVDGSMIDQFEWCFVDMDLKDAVYESKDQFLEVLATVDILPTKVIDSGNGIHSYWRVQNLDPMSYLRFQRRLMRLLHTDEAVGQLFQLMRLPNYRNTKDPVNKPLCMLLFENNVIYTAEQLDKLLPPITITDEAYCKQHYNKTYGIDQKELNIPDEIPPKFGKLLRDNQEAKGLWSETSNDRSKSDYRLAHIMLANGFTKEEAASVLINSAKALQRAPVHRQSYASNIIDKVFTYEITGHTDSPTVQDILSRNPSTLQGVRFPCNKLLDDTEHGFRLGQIVGIIGGSGVGKTTLTLNMFLWFCANNPDYHHFFFSLEQPEGEIAARIKLICGDNTSMYSKIHIVSNYAADGTFNQFSMQKIEDHLLSFQKNTGSKVGATVIDHIGVLDKQTKNGEYDGLIGICRKMKETAVRVNTMLIMLSQAPREKSGVGDIELNKDSAFGTVFFESFCDYCLCLWQPLKRAYTKGAPTVMAFKFAKIRHKRQNIDRIKEDTCYQLFFDPKTERLRELTQAEEVSAKHYVSVATNLRKLDRKTDIIPYESRRIVEEENAKKS